jgi:hypothetical protein
MASFESCNNVGRYPLVKLTCVGVDASRGSEISLSAQRRRLLPMRQTARANIFDRDCDRLVQCGDYAIIQWSMCEG